MQKADSRIRISVTLTVKQYNTLAVRAASEYVSIAHLIRTAIDAAQAAHKPLKRRTP